MHPDYCWDLIDHQDILVFSLWWGEDLLLLANICSDEQQTAICLLYEWTMDWPGLFLMGRDFNCWHHNWDPQGLDGNIHASHLEAAATCLGLFRCIPEGEGPTHFSYNPLLKPIVIDLLYLPMEQLLCMWHCIMPNIRGIFDHTLLVTDVPTPMFEMAQSKL